MHPWLLILRLLALALLGLTLLVVVALFFWQDVLIYHPRPYGPGRVERFGRRLEPLEYRTDQGRQTAFYLPPRGQAAASGALPAALWVLFVGNGSLALDWEDLLVADPDPDRAFLLVDYPGYGRNAGRAAPASIRQGSEAALAALAARLGRRDAADLANRVPRLGTAGHSLGAAVALDFAVAHPAVSRVILLAPFTSLRDMARRTVGWPLSGLLRGNFDNRARLDALAARPSPPPPQVVIFHGERDNFIPPAMGRALAAAHPDVARFELVPGANHDDLLLRAESRLRAALDAP